MKDALEFLKGLKEKTLSPALFLVGDDDYIREKIRKRVLELWQDPDSDTESLNLVGIEGAESLPSAMGMSSFFSSRKVIFLLDAPAKRKKEDHTPFSFMGKKQMAALVEAIGQIPQESVRLVIDPASAKRDTGLQKALSAVTVQVDVFSPKGKIRHEWISLLARKAGATLDHGLEEMMVASEASLRTLAYDLEKVSLATPEGGKATVPMWQALTQADPQSTIWEIGDNLGVGNTGGVLRAIKNLESGGLDVYGIVPAILSWNQQRLQVKSYTHSRSEGDPPGIHPFVAKKIRAQVTRKSLEQLRQEQRKLFRLDRSLKQSWENPHTLLEKLLVEFSQRSER